MKYFCLFRFNFSQLTGCHSRAGGNPYSRDGEAFAVTDKSVVMDSRLRGNDKFLAKLRFFTIGLFSLLAACAFSSPPERLHYQINPAEVLPQVAPAATKSPDILRIAAPKGDFGLASDGIQIQTADLNITKIENAAWVEPLNKMLEPLLVQSLENSGLFTAVVDDDSPATASLELQTSIERFTLVYPADSSPPHVEVTLRVNLIQLPENKLISSRRFSASEPVQTVRITYIISAFEHALSRCLAQLAAGINR